MQRLLLPLLALPLFACSAPSASVGVHVGQYALDGDVGLATAAAGGAVNATTSLDGLGLGDDSTSLGADVVINLGVPTLVLSAVQTDYSGNGTLAGDFEVDGVTLPAGTDVASALDVSMYQAFFLFEVVPGDTVDLAIGLGVDMLDFDGSFTGDTDPTAGVAIETLTLDQPVPLPVAGARAAIALGPVDLSAFVTGAAFDFDDVEVSALDIDLRAGFSVFGPLSAFVGYRDNAIEVDYVDGTDAGRIDLSIGGPYLGVRASF